MRQEKKTKARAEPSRVERGQKDAEARRRKREGIVVIAFLEDTRGGGGGGGGGGVNYK